MRRDVKDPTLVPKEKTRIRRMIDRVWAPYLSPAEQKVVAFICTTTIEWSKRSDRLKVDHFINGFRAAGGIGLSDKTIREALNGLERDGAISRKRTPYGYLTALILTWEPAAMRAPRTRATTFRKSVPAISEAPVNTPQIAGEIGTSCRSRSVKGTDAYIGEDTGERIPDYRSPSDGAPVSLKRDRPGREKVTRSVDPLDITNLRVTWTAAIADAFPEVTLSAWGARQDAQACLFVRVADKSKRTNALDVLAWSVRSWRLIVAARFGWMTDRPPPEFPDVGFMLAFRDRFYDAWSDRERLRAEVNLSGRDRRVRQLQHQGMSADEAQRDAADRDALANERAKVAETQARLNDMLCSVEQRRTLIAEQRLAAAVPHVRSVRSSVVRPVSTTEAAFGGFEVSAVSF